MKKSAKNVPEKQGGENIVFRNGKYIVKRGRPGYIAMAISMVIIIAVIAICLNGIIGYIQEKNYIWMLFNIIIVMLILMNSVRASVAFFTSLVIDDRGITKKTMFIKKTLPWYEVRDYGLTRRSAQNKLLFTDIGEGCFILYFSESRLQNITDNSKDTDGALFMYIPWEEYDGVVNTLVPFCESHTGVEPLITDRPGGDHEENK